MFHRRAFDDWVDWTERMTESCEGPESGVTE